MSLLLSVKNITKSMGAKNLFVDLSFGIFQGEKIGLTGPNGVGKTTFLKILAEEETPDYGEVSFKRQLKMAYVPQKDVFPENLEILDFLTTELIQKYKFERQEADIQAAMSLSIVGFTEFNQLISELSGGWRKRLAIAKAIALEPELLILDEPTNHMDWDGIIWLESWLRSFNNSLLLVSHDRKFLENNVNRVVELNPLYKSGYLSFNCSYSDFLVKKSDFIQAQMKEQESLANKTSREVSWLRAGVKARTTKSKSRMDAAHNMIDELSDLKRRNYSITKKSRIEIDASDRKTKKLLELKGLEISFSETPLISNLNLVLGPKNCLGLLGSNGSGKTSLLKVITEELKPTKGSLFLADHIKIVFFDQKRESLNKDLTLLEYLGDGSDYVIFKDESTHVASYANRFMFYNEKMNLKISQLSGGEQARLLIAKILLHPADILILDEPTNDLDIETIELLEDTLMEFPGLILLVSHDRSFMDTLCTQFLALDGRGGQTLYSSLGQWLKDFAKSDDYEIEKPGSIEKPKNNKKKKLSYKEKIFLDEVETSIQAKESDLSELEKKLQDPNVMADQSKLNKVIQEISTLQTEIDQTYKKWDEVEAKKANA